jgi:hypothetical protein
MTNMKKLTDFLAKPIVNDLLQILYGIMFIGLILLGLVWMWIVKVVKILPLVGNWILTVGFIVLGLILLTDFILISLVFMTVGILISPYMTEWIENRFHLNWNPNYKTLVVLFGLAIVAIPLIFYKTGEQSWLVTDEQHFLAGLLVQMAWIDYHHDQELFSLRSYLDRDELIKTKKTYFEKRVELSSKLQSLYQNGDYQQVINQGSPYTAIDSQILDWVSEAKKRLKQQQIETASKKVPQLMKAGKYREAYRLAVPIKEPQLQKVAAKAQQKIDKELSRLRYWYERGWYKKVMKAIEKKNENKLFEGDCRVKRLVLDAKKAQALKEENARIDKALKKIANLIKAHNYRLAIESASQSEYANIPRMKALIKKAKFKQKKAKEKKILAKLRNIPATYIEANIREYTNLVKLFPENEKYNEKLEYYKKELIDLRRQPPLLVTQEQYGDNWPFTVSQGYLECFPPGIITFKVNEKAYAVNSLATSRGYPKINAIWKDDPNLGVQSSNRQILTKVDITPIINMGLDLCKPPS